MIPLGLKIALAVAAIFSVIGLVVTVSGAMKFKRRRPLAPSRGSEAKGIQYALVGGMMPWAKESARNHLPTYFTGILYHVGIAVGVVALILAIASVELTANMSKAVVVLASLGAIAGAGLLIKRLSTNALRAISTLDDYISNGLVTLFLLMAAMSYLELLPITVFAISTIFLLVYVPLGKIRHCFLFFFSRVTFGKFFGRRGVLPQRAAGQEEPHVKR